MKNLLRNALLLVFVFVLSIPEAFCQLFTWESKAPMPTARVVTTSSVVNGKIYIIGGLEEVASSLDETPVNEAYNPLTNSWEIKSSMPTPRQSMASVVDNGIIYVIGGYSNLVSTYFGLVETYNPATNSWSILQPMNYPRSSLGAEVVNGKIYAIGGDDDIGNLNTLEEYNISTNTWTLKTPMPTARNGFATCVVNGKIYVIGGAIEGVTSSYDLVEIYDPQTNSWTTGSPMPTAREALVAESYNDKIYAIGGGTGLLFANLFSTVEEFDTQIGSWSNSTPMPTARWGSSSTIYDGKIYVFGGGVSLFNLTGTVEAFTVGNPSSLEENESSFPKQFSLQQNYPNPFNPNTRISFDLFRSSEVELTIYNSLGKEITTLSQGKLNSGNHNFDWNGTDQSGKSVSSGLYVYKLKTENGFANKKMLLIK